MNRIRQLRKALGLSQTQFGETIGVKTTIVSSWENGDREITEGRINLICKIHKVRREWLVEGTGDMFDTAETMPILTRSELIMAAGGEIFRNLPDEYQVIYLRFLHRLRDNGGDLMDAIKEFPTMSGAPTPIEKKDTEHKEQEIGKIENQDGGVVNQTINLNNN